MSDSNWKRYPGDRSTMKDHPLMAEPEGECFDCHHAFGAHEEQFEDTMKNPQCESCHDRLREKAEALLEAMKEEEGLRREMAGMKQDRRESDRINGRY